MENKEIWLDTLTTDTPQEGRELAIKNGKKIYWSHSTRYRNQKEVKKRLCQ